MFGPLGSSGATGPAIRSPFKLNTMVLSPYGFNPTVYREETSSKGTGSSSPSPPKATSPKKSDFLAPITSPPRPATTPKALMATSQSLPHLAVKEAQGLEATEQLSPTSLRRRRYEQYKVRVLKKRDFLDSYGSQIDFRGLNTLLDRADAYLEIKNQVDDYVKLQSEN